MSRYESGRFVEHRNREHLETDAEVHKPFTDDDVTYCGWDKHEGCGELWPCSAVRARGGA